MRKAMLWSVVATVLGAFALGGYGGATNPASTPRAEAGAPERPTAIES